MHKHLRSNGNCRWGIAYTRRTYFDTFYQGQGP